MHSKKYKTVKDYFDRGLWSKRRIHDAVEKGWITAQEYSEITKEHYY